jgi:hypothetical protein
MALWSTLTVYSALAGAAGANPNHHKRKTPLASGDAAGFGGRAAK